MKHTYFLHQLFVVFTLLFAAGSNLALAEPPLQLFYFERIPYSVSDSRGNVSGLVASPAANALKKAGIQFQWKKMPFKRQLETIKYNKKRACGIGWFKNPEREKFTRFTNAIYQDKPSITISKNGNHIVSQHKDIVSLFKDKSIKLLIKDGFSYGAYIDEQIQKQSPETVAVVSSKNVQMLQTLLAGRADYFFASKEEAEHIITEAGYSVSQFHLQEYDDIPLGNSRYIGCSQQVEPELIDRINQALKQ